MNIKRQLEKQKKPLKRWFFCVFRLRNFFQKQSTYKLTTFLIAYFPDLYTLSFLFFHRGYTFAAHSCDATMFNLPNLTG